MSSTPADGASADGASAENEPIDGTPDSWRHAVREIMASFDIERRDLWRPMLEEGRNCILGLFVEINDAEKTLALALQPVFDDLCEHDLWGQVRTTAVLNTLASIVGQSRGAGDEHLTPTCGDMMFSGIGVVLAERSVAGHLFSSSFYLYDRAGNYYIRRFMGGNQGEPQIVGGSIDIRISDEEACAQAEKEPHFHDIHAALGRLVHASLSDPAECRATYGENVFGELRDVIEKLRAQQDPTHPLHPHRVN